MEMKFYKVVTCHVKIYWSIEKMIFIFRLISIIKGKPAFSHGLQRKCF